MDQQDDPGDSMAAARRHVQALTECGLPPEALLRALLEQYDGRRQVPANDGIAFTQPSSTSHTPRLSVSTTSTTSTGRVSYMSTATTATTASSVSSHSSLLPQIQVVPPRGQASTRAYWCLECDTKFARKFDWKRHEDEFHERHKKYPCPETGCNRIFWGSNTFNQHHKTKHGCKTCPHADKVIRYTKKKRAWGCGFCAAFLPSMDRYYDHVALHFESGRTKAHWSHSNVIYGLLHQPCVYETWKALRASKYGHLPKEQQPRLGWDPKSTGRTQGYLENESPGQLQDLLEFFDPNRGSAQVIAQLALDRAITNIANTLEVPTPVKSEKSRSQKPRQPSTQQYQFQTQAQTPEPSNGYKDAWAAYENTMETSQNDFDPSALPQPLFSQSHQLSQIDLAGLTTTVPAVPGSTLSFLSEGSLVPSTMSHTFDDWTSLASTMVDEAPVQHFSDPQPRAWQHNPFGNQGFNS